MIGDIRVEILNAGSLWLDGGAMFGVVPKALWEKKIAADDQNRIGLCMSVLLVRAGGRNLLLDTGAGTKEDEKFRAHFGLEEPPLLADLRAHGLGPEDIHVVVNTHLHFDHAGGNTLLDESGRLHAAFPNARYLVQRQEFEDAMAPNERNRASYFAANYEPLADSGQMEFLDGETEILPGVRAFPLPGHTAGLQGLFLESQGQRGLYLADCVPTHHHVPLPWIMGYDLYPLTTLETKRRLLPLAASEGWTLFFEHDPEVRAARIEQDAKGRFAILPVEP